MIECSAPGSGEGLKKKFYIKSPVYELHETSDCIVAAIELPGVSKEDIDLTIDESNIEIEGKKEPGFLETKENAVQHYFRKIRLPNMVVPKRAKAKYRNGILNIEMPKIKAPKQRS